MADYRPKLDLSDWQVTNEREFQQILQMISPELHSFIREHNQLAKLMDRVREGYDEQVYKTALDEIGYELDHHFTLEETLILPRLARHIPFEEVGPVKKLRQEHQLIRNRFEDAREQLRAGREEPESRQLLMQKMNLLAYLMKKHIEKEDHYFFPMASVILTQAEKEEIAEETGR